jgi:hypothetical protein
MAVGGQQPDPGRAAALIRGVADPGQAAGTYHQRGRRRRQRDPPDWLARVPVIGGQQRVLAAQHVQVAATSTPSRRSQHQDWAPSRELRGHRTQPLSDCKFRPFRPCRQCRGAPVARLAAPRRAVSAPRGSVGRRAARSTRRARSGTPVDHALRQAGTITSLEALTDAEFTTRLLAASRDMGRVGRRDRESQAGIPRTGIPRRP